MQPQHTPAAFALARLHSFVCGSSPFPPARCPARLGSNQREFFIQGRPALQLHDAPKGAPCHRPKGQAMNVIDAAHATVHDYPGGSEPLALRLKMAGAVLRGKVNSNDPRHHLTLAESMRIQHFTGDHRILFAEAAELGYVVIPAPTTELGDEDVTKAITLFCGTFADYLGDVSTSMADGKITDNERKALERELCDLMAAGSHLQAVLSSKNGR